jgi:lactoylglutathione lyase
MKKISLFCLIASLLIITNTGFSQVKTGKPKALLNHVAIFVVDLEKTRAFYNDMFQLDTIPEPFHDGKHIWYSIAPGVAMHVIQGAEKPKEYYLNNHTCFSVPSVDEFVAKLKARNLPWFNSKAVKGEITTRVDGVKQIWVNDPDGYFIEVNDAKF